MNCNIKEQYEIKRKQLLTAIDDLLPLNEWNEQLIRQAEKRCDFEQYYANLLFPGRITEIINQHQAMHDELMLEYLQANITPVKITNKIALALSVRIKNFIPKSTHIKNYSFFTLPNNFLLGMEMYWRTCSLIWYYAGDEAVDFNYYTKRSLLLSVYLPSILFYIADESEQYIETEKFIKKSLANIVKIGNFKNSVKLPKLENIPFLRLFS